VPFKVQHPKERDNIGGNCQKTNLDLLACICDKLQHMHTALLKQPHISFFEDRPRYNLCYAIDASKIQRELGWGPAHNFTRGIFNTISWHLVDLALAR